MRITVRHNTHQLMFYMMLLNVKAGGFVFPKERKAKEIADGEPINIQSGNRIADPEKDEAFYTQWLIDIAQENAENGFADRMVTYFDRINSGV